MKLRNKTILVTGATSGIGHATSVRLIEDGARVVAVGRNKGRLGDMAKQWGDSCLVLPQDLSLVEVFPEFIKQIPKLDGVVMSAGIVKNNPIKFFDRATFDEILKVNLVSPLLLTVALSNGGHLEPGCSIAFLSSTNGTTVGIKGTLAYASTKAALTGAAKVLALELSGKGIRVNCIAPGMVATEMVTNLSQLSEEMIKADMAKYPLGKRYAQPREIADLVAFLMSNESSFITGQTLTIDGGYCIQ